MIKADAESNRTGKQRGFLAGLLTAILVSVPVVAVEVVGGVRQEQEVPAMTTITTRLGAIVGKSENDIQIYRGVPYAKPPVGERRFKAPELRGPWSGTLDATRPGNRAMQPKIPGLGSSSATYSEDCLVEDIYTHAADGRARPVLFWICLLYTSPSPRD